ncbi:MAG: glutamate 5-kinase [Clostridia bacterium]|nr:glutamate 5-kinase [Clostridia bacterium]
MGMFAKCKRVVVKVGTSTLTHENGQLDLRRISDIVRILSDFKNAGKEIILVSSGAVSAGVARMGLGRRPETVAEKQAAAAVGQTEIMKLYSSLFADYGHSVGQILMTRDVIENPERRSNAQNTFNALLALGCVPIVNENDSVATEELFGGNDKLAAYVALVAEADILLNLSDIDGLFDSDPRKNPNAKLIERVEDIDAVMSLAGGNGTERGTGGMITKLQAAKIVTEQKIPMFILNGHKPELLYDLLDEKHVGTYFTAK